MPDMPEIWTPYRSAPKGRQQMGETGFCKNLRVSAVSSENLRFPAVCCANLRLPNPLIYRASRKSAKICKNLRRCAFRVRFLPFAVSLLARPDPMVNRQKVAKNEPRPIFCLCWGYFRRASTCVACPMFASYTNTVISEEDHALRT